MKAVETFGAIGIAALVLIAPYEAMAHEIFDEAKFSKLVIGQINSIIITAGGRPLLYSDGETRHMFSEYISYCQKAIGMQCNLIIAEMPCEELSMDRTTDMALRADIEHVSKSMFPFIRTRMAHNKKTRLLIFGGY